MATIRNKDESKQLIIESECLHLHASGGLLLASISESASVPRRRKFQPSSNDGTDKKIQLVSSTTVAKKEFTVQDLLSKSTTKPVWTIPKSVLMLE